MTTVEPGTEIDEARERLAPIPVEDRLCLALAAASRAMGGLYRPLLVKVNLTYPQFLVMSLLWEDHTHVVSTLADRLALDPSTISPLLKRLEARGLVVRSRDSRDERRVVVTATERGMALEHEAELIPGKVNAATHLTANEERSLVRQLKTLTLQLER